MGHCILEMGWWEYAMVCRSILWRRAASTLSWSSFFFI